VASKTLYFDIIGRDKSGSATLTKVGTGLLAFGAAAGVATGAAIKAFADFDQKMTSVQALSHATGAEMEGLTSAALSMGQAIGLSAGQVADAETELVKAGVSVKDILGGGLRGALNLAAAGQIDVAESTQIATVALTQFGLAGKDVPHVADLLAAGADKALGGVDQLGQALQQGGLVASRFGLTIDDTVGTLSAFANAGLLGSDAGTSMKTMFLALASPSGKAADTMKQLGINAYDAQGKFVGVTNLAGQLHDKLGPLADAQRNAALATIFGTDAIRSASVLMEQGADGIQGWIDSVNDTGFAAEQARKKTDNLNGDLDKLRAALENDLIKTGAVANDSLRGIVQTGTNLITMFGNAPAPVQETALTLGAVAAGAAVLGGGMLILVPKIEATRQALRRLNSQGVSTGKILGKGSAIFLGVAALASGIGGLGAESELSADKLAKVDAVTKSMSKAELNRMFKDAGVAIVDATASSDKFKESLNAIATGNFWENEAGFTKFVDGITFGLTHLSDVYKTNEAQLRRFGQNLGDQAKTNFPAAVDGFKKMVEAAGGGKEAIRQLLTTMPDYKAALIELSGQQGKTLSDQELMNLAVGKGAVAFALMDQPVDDNKNKLADLGGTAQTTKGDIDDLADTIRSFGKAQFDLNAAERDFQAALQAVTDSVNQNGTSLDISTEAGRSNQEALDNIAKSALDVASATLQRTGSEQQAQAAIQAGRDELIKQLAQFGITGAAADQYADQLGLIPGNIPTAVSVTGVDTAIAEAERLRARLQSIKNTQWAIDVAVALHGADNLATTGGLRVARAGGGDLDMAPGPKGVDSMFFKGAKGEHVLTADDVDAMGGQQAVYAFRRRLHAVSNRAASIGLAPEIQAAPVLSISTSASQSATPVIVQITNKTDVRLNDLIDARIHTAQGWQTIELNSGEGR